MNIKDKDLRKVLADSHLIGDGFDVLHGSDIIDDFDKLLEILCKSEIIDLRYERYPEMHGYRTRLKQIISSSNKIKEIEAKIDVMEEQVNGLEKNKQKLTPIKIGKYCISQSQIQADHVSIYCEDGEGGEFSKSDFLKVIDKFYMDNF